MEYASINGWHYMTSIINYILRHVMHQEACKANERDISEEE